MQPAETVCKDQAVTVAVLDLGSNSFHMLVARLGDASIQIIDKLREPVRLAAGLDANGSIDAEARERALRCLARFGQRLRSMPSVQVRAVGTNTWREATDSGRFLRDAGDVLGHPIEVISGVEEARLIYAGVMHGVAPDEPRRLVVDIGGGSTELIAGQLSKPQLVESVPLGCVTLTEHFFPGGAISDKNWQDALMQAKLEVQPYAKAFQHYGWRQAIGASGTLRAIRKVVCAQGWAECVITRAGLHRLSKALCKSKTTSQLKLQGLSKSRREVFPGGVAILTALFEELAIDQMDTSDAALREGLLLEFVERRRGVDTRIRSVDAMAARFNVDRAHAERVGNTAKLLLAKWHKTAEPTHAVYLKWAALLHEIGLDISHSGYHKHGAYIVENADLMGFSRSEQALMARLVLIHRGRLQSQAFEMLPPPFTTSVRSLGIVLRLAVILHRNRQADFLPTLGFCASGRQLSLHFPAAWLTDHPLTRADLAKESATLKAIGCNLRFGDG